VNGKNDAAKVQTVEVPEKYRKNPESRNTKENAADIEYRWDTTCRNYKHYGRSNKGTRHKIPPNKGKIPEPGEKAEFARITRKM
jgi:hypothetical protein